MDTFAAIHAPRLEVPRAVLRRALWGEWYWKPKTKQIVDGGSAPKGAEPLFASLVLANVWKVYDAVSINYNPERVAKIVSSLGITVDARELAQVSARTPLPLNTPHPQHPPHSTSTHPHMHGAACPHPGAHMAQLLV